MEIRLTLKELKKWVEENTDYENNCLKELYFDNKKVIKIKYDTFADDIFIFQTEDGCLNYTDYSYCMDGNTSFCKIIERWRAEKDENYYHAYFVHNRGKFETLKNVEEYCNSDNKIYLSGNYFRTQKEAQKFADDLNEAIAPLFEKAKNGGYDEKD